MANPLRGEVAFTVADVEYTLKFSTNAICELEQLQNKGLNEIVGDLERVSTVRAMLWAALRAKHSDITLKGAGEIMDRAGMPATVEAISNALRAGFPPPTGDDPNA
jgi:hypothetical protein